tara:strand:+ start:58232 stop:59281 length:1050 start_codon:yes stop_codon:yes gene_type:complete
MIEAYLLTFLLTFFICFSTVFFFKKLDIVDKPDGIRKIHKGEISLGGGIAIYFASSIILIFLVFGGDIELDQLYINLLKLWIISLIILFLGLWDDIRPLPFSARLIFQIFASWLVIMATDVYLRDLGNLFGVFDIYLGKLGIPITIFMVVGVCNAFNMLDGMDGLVGFVVFIASTTLALVAFGNESNYFLFFGSAILIVFLLFNLGLFGKKWKIFLGDSGAMWLGFIVAWLLVTLSQSPSDSFLKPVTALWLILLPLIDALSTFMKRLSSKQSLFLGDRSHIHHILLDSGYEKWKILLLFIFITTLSCSFAAYFVQNNTEEYIQFYGFIMIWISYFLIIKYPDSKKKRH